MNKLPFHAVYYTIRLTGLLPLRVLYIFSDFTYYLVYYVFRYRKAVVFENLRNSFPEKSGEEIRALAKRYYRHLCDLFAETIHQPGMGENEIRNRVKFKNPEIIDKYFNEGRHIAAVMGHYNNWEWMCGFPLITGYKCITIYRQLKNRIFDKLMYDMRSRFGAELVPMKMAIRKIYEYDKLGAPTITAFIADQTPPREKSLFWLKFLNQDTSVYLGPARLARKMNMAVVFFKMKKVKRGYYELDFIPLFENTSDSDENEITLAHVSELEKQIRCQPEFWLWSHRRWKIRRE
jgi:Kdo2-lipid IVA lauroyltransferase/acyltransferase